MKAETTSFVTIDGTIEVMMTELTNTADQERRYGCCVHFMDGVQTISGIIVM